MDDNSEKTPSLLALDERAGGTTVHAFIGQKVLLALPSAANGGYEWFFTSLGGLPEPARETIEPEVIGEPPIGGPPVADIFIWKISAMDAGNHVVTMVERRFWEKEVIRRFSVTLVIT